MFFLLSGLRESGIIYRKYLDNINVNTTILFMMQNFDEAMDFDHLDLRAFG